MSRASLRERISSPPGAILAGLFHLRLVRSPAWATRIAHSPVPAARRAQGDHLTDARLPKHTAVVT